MDALQFRLLTSKDKAAVVALFQKCFALPLEDLEISWEYRSHKDSFGFWKGGALLGFALGSYHLRSGGSLYIDYFALHESVRGNGLGTQILRPSWQISREVSISFLFLRQLRAGILVMDSATRTRVNTSIIRIICDSVLFQTNKRIMLLHTSYTSWTESSSNPNKIASAPR